MPDRPALREAYLVAALATGNMLPDAIMQYAMADIEGITLDMGRLQRRRDHMLEALGGMGYEVPRRARHVLYADESDIDLNRASDRKAFKDRTAAAVYYSDRLSEKIRSSLRAKRDNNEWKGGGTRPFGYRVVPDPKRSTKDQVRYTVVLNPREAKLLRQAAADVLAGRALRAIAREWNAAGVTTSTGKRWEGYRVGQTLKSEHLDGSAGMPAVLDAETAEQVRSLLNDPARQRYASPAVRRHYLVGTVRCGRCGTKMTAHPNYHGVRTYICRKGYDGTGCGRMRIVADPVEEYVNQKLIDRDDRAHEEQSQVSDLPAVDSEHVRQIEANLEQLARDHYVDGLISRPEYFAAKAGLDEQLKALRQEVARTTRKRPRRMWDSLMASAPDTWAENVSDPAMVEVLAEFAHRYLAAVRVNPAPRRGPGVPPEERVEIVWR